MKTRLLFVHALSPIHCGTGQAVSGIDLPIIREKPTNIPLAPGSSIKGVLRASAVGPADKAIHAAVFGPPTKNASDNAGSVQFSDANLVFLPMRSVRGTFAWATSPYMLQRLARDAREGGHRIDVVPQPENEQSALVTSDVLKAGSQVIFEDFDFRATQSAELQRVAKWIADRVFAGASPAEREFFASRVCVVHDNVMSVLLQTGTEITARIRLQPETKTVETGGLWYEEALPVESILSGLVVATPVQQKETKQIPSDAALIDYVAGLVAGKAIQLGGKANIGRGLCHVTLVAEGRDGNA